VALDSGFLTIFVPPIARRQTHIGLIRTCKGNSPTMGWNDHIDLELHDLIEDAVDTGWLEEALQLTALRKR
jgi:hypothetical protein